MKQYTKPFLETIQFQAIQSIALNPYDAAISADGKTTVYSIALLGDKVSQPTI